MTFTMEAYKKNRKGIYKTCIIDVCCEKLSNEDLEHICKEDDKWMAGGEGLNYYEMFFCPFCGSKLN